MLEVFGHIATMGTVRDAERGRLSRFERLYVELHPVVSAYVVRRLPEAVDPGDVVAEVFTVLWRRLEELPPSPADRLWIFGVARRCVSQATRASARRHRLLARLAAAPPAAHRDADSRLVVREAIATLPPGEAEALRLVAWEGLSHEEAAQVLQCSVNAVAIRIHRARKRLQALLADPSAVDQSQPV